MATARQTIVRVLVVVILSAIFGLGGVFIYGSLVTNRMVERLHRFEPGEPFSAVVERHGPPDVIENVEGYWKRGQRIVAAPKGATKVAVYAGAIAPQVCAFFLDDQDRIVSIEAFAGYR